MTTSLVRRLDARITADPRRVLARLFVPGHELVTTTESRATGVLGRVLALPDTAVTELLARLHRSYDGRHRDLAAVFERHHEQIAHRIPDGVRLTPERACLIGAVFTHEFSIEGAALFNPSAVAHPDQSGLAEGECRFVLSLRAVGEGHLSSVEFRTGVLGPEGALRLDDPGPHVEGGQPGPTTQARQPFADLLREQGADTESARFLLSKLPEHFGPADLDAALGGLAGQAVTRLGGARTEELARQIARASYQVVFDPASRLSERVLWPQTPAESRGMEDVRFVRFDDGGEVRYLATYTAFDGERIAPQLLETADFRTFHARALAGPAAKNKGLALFPRTVGGRHLALSRWDRENCWLAVSQDGLTWEHDGLLHAPTQPWELIQTGNSGSPLETEAGWLVLTHSVGPMREYAVGALLLDLDDPSRVIGVLPEPLLAPDADERDGYVPNVVYSCGAMLHGDRLLLPYGASDDSVRFAIVDVPALLARLTGG